MPRSHACVIEIDHHPRQGPCHQPAVGHLHGARTDVWPSLRMAVERAVERASISTCASTEAARKIPWCALERRNLNEMIGNLVENAAKYGGGGVFVTVELKVQPGSTSSWRTAAMESRRPSASAYSIVAIRGSTAASRARTPSASPSSAYAPKSMAERSNLAKAKIWAALLVQLRLPSG